MLNRRILRIKAFKVLYAAAENPDLSLKEALGSLDASCEASRDLYLYMMGVIPALTAEAARRTEAARTKFNPTPEELNPNLKFVKNAVSALLDADPDFARLNESRRFSWAQNDAFIFNLWETLKTREYFTAYMNSTQSSLQDDVTLWKTVFTDEFEDNDALAAILEDLSIHWADDLAYALGACIRTLDGMARTGRWDFPPLFQSDILKAQGKQVDSDSDFVHKLLTAAYGRREEYSRLISSSVSKWDLDRLCTSDIILVSMGLSEAATFPEIPVKVTINEYVEIAKYYSTPRSGAFVNGLLDRLAKQLEAEGKIVKSGKGLI
ncbi:MAG: transcription antitermination protein NusB [Bacteroidales bacterium]|nr:transcription antitermination protein NusB [Bacteroidales bacterium]